MPLVKYTLIRFVLFAIPFVICLYLRLGLVASTLIAAVISLCLSYLLLASMRDEISEWAIQQKKKKQEKVSRSEQDNAAEDAAIQ